MPSSPSIQPWRVARRQLTALALFLLLAGLVLGALYWRDRQQEWPLREEQANYRLELGYKLLVREIDQVRSSLLYLADRPDVRGVRAGDEASFAKAEQEFVDFLRFQESYQQIRLVDREGREQVRVDYSGGAIQRVPANELQDKSERYYIREALPLEVGQVLVSEFDLNQERGLIEEPLNPVIRLVSPIDSGDGTPGSLLVINFSGRRLLDELRAISMPGFTLLVRSDGHYVLGPTGPDAWGWLLGHDHTFARQFPEAWEQRERANQRLLLTPAGAFAMRSIHLRPFLHPTPPRDPLYLVSWLPRDKVFESSRQVLLRLLFLLGLMLIPLFLLTRIWAVGTVRREAQNQRIAASERKLRELSARLVRIQEEERRAISREIHDQWGQQVTAINLDLKLAAREHVSGTPQAGLERAIRQSERLLDSLHHIASRIRPAELDDLGLADAIESHLWEFQQRTGIATRLIADVGPLEIPPVVAENVFRLVQESLNNVLKHAAASEVEVRVDSVPRGDSETWLRVVVSDNGRPSETRGQAARDEAPRLGILGMRERVDLLGGQLDLDFDPAHGTTVTAQVPLTVSPPDQPAGDPE